MHHATLYIGDLEEALRALPEPFREAGADVHHFFRERLTIDDAREIGRLAVLRPLTKDMSIFVIAGAYFTIEAQNALLKTLEEPVPTTAFYIIVPRESVLLPTVRSRSMVMRLPSVSSERPGVDSFMRMEYGSRLAVIASHASKKDDAALEAMLRDIEYESQMIESNEVRASVYTSIILARRFFGFPGASKKMLLEHVALVLPHSA